jgi:hypothetical protein
MATIDPSIDFVQNINLPSPSQIIPEVGNELIMRNNENNAKVNYLSASGDSNPYNDDTDLNQLFK